MKHKGLSGTTAGLLLLACESLKLGVYGLMPWISAVFHGVKFDSSQALSLETPHRSVSAAPWTTAVTHHLRTNRNHRGKRGRVRIRDDPYPLGVVSAVR